MTAGKARSAFAYEPTETSIEVAWDEFAEAENETVAGILISVGIQITRLMRALFSEAELEAMKVAIAEPVQTGVTVNNLLAGITHTFQVAATDADNQLVPNATLLQTAAPTREHSVFHKLNVNGFAKSILFRPAAADGDWKQFDSECRPDSRNHSVLELHQEHTCRHFEHNYNRKCSPSNTDRRFELLTRDLGVC